MLCRASLPSMKLLACKFQALLLFLYQLCIGMEQVSSCSSLRRRSAQVDGRAMTGPDLSVTHFSGLKLPNPFVIGSGVHQLPNSL